MGSEKYVGLDVHKDTISIAVMKFRQKAGRVAASTAMHP